MINHDYKSCFLCPRKCGINRTSDELGFCGASNTISAARAALHHWEEPPISGKNGSGAVFFSHCSLQCVFCQNRAISKSNRAFGITITTEALSSVFLSLQTQGAHNINLVSATHYVPTIIDAIKLARKNGFSLPIVYNSSGYELVSTLQLLRGYVDIYLPDYKYYSSYYSKKYSSAADYRDYVIPALEEMVLQAGNAKYDANGIMQKGVIIRHLMLPGLSGDTAQILRDIASRFSDTALVSLMRQYTPFQMEKYPEINRTITDDEYSESCELFLSLGLTGFFQDSETATESFIPHFDGTGLLGKVKKI